MTDFAVVASRLARICNESIPRIAAIYVVAVAAAIAGVIVVGWDGVAYADGGADARKRAAADESGETIRDYALRMLRMRAEDDANGWARYWRTRAECEAVDYALDGVVGEVSPLDRALLGLAEALCAQLAARLGTDPADYPPRGEESGVGLTLNEPGAAAGYTLFTVMDSQKAYLIDPLGRVAHTWHLEDAISGEVTGLVKLLDNGNLMAMAVDLSSTENTLSEIDPRGNVVWRYDSSHEIHHDFVKMPNGNLLLLGRESKTREQAIAEGASPDFEYELFIYDTLIEMRPTGASGGEVVWEWSAWDHMVQDLDPGKPNYGAIAERPELIDMNFLLNSRGGRGRPRWMGVEGIDYNPALDQIMLSPRHYSELWVIDHSATTEEARGHSGGNSGMGGDLLYRWGNPRAYGHGDADDQRLFRHVNAHWIPPGLPGAGNIIALNSGNESVGYGRGYSSIDEIAPPADGYRYRRDSDSDYPPDRLEWTYAAETPADFYAWYSSGAQRLPNGNTLIADAPAGTIFQVTPDGRIVWKYVVPYHYHISLWQDGGAPSRLTYEPPRPWSAAKNAVYRAYWYPPDYPGLQSLELTPGAYLEDTPDLLDWKIAGLIAGDFGERLDDSNFEIYLDKDGDEDILIYFKRQPCAAEDARAKFFLHIFPADARDLPAHRQEHGFDNRDFGFDGRGKAHGGWCSAIAPLPGYEIGRIRTGQHMDGSKVWQADIDFRE